MEVVAQNVTAQKVIAQKDEFLQLASQVSSDSTPTMGSSTGIALATLDTQHYIQNVFRLLISHPKFLALNFTASV